MSVLAYLVYGNDRRYQLELTYSVLSATRFMKEGASDDRIVLVCDEVNRRHDLPVEHAIIAPDTLRAWQMNGSYKHAAKIRALHHVLETYRVPAVLIDTDTILNCPPAQLFGQVQPGHALMHDREGRLGDRQDWAVWQAIVDKTSGRVGGLVLDADTVMFNSGVLGLHPADIGLLEQVMAVLSDIRRASDVFTAEQLAAGMVLAKECRVAACGGLVEHYWDGPRDYYHYQLCHMFPGVIAGEGLGEPPHPLPALRGMPKGRLLPRVLARARRIQRRASAGYEWAYLCYLMAFSLCRSDPHMANVWAMVAVNKLVWGLGERPLAAVQDFSRLSPANLHASSWLRPEVRKRWHQYWVGEVGPPSQ